MRYRQHSTYSRHLVSIVTCFTLIVLGSASCLRTIQAAWPSSHASYSGSTNALYSSPIEEDNSVSEDEAVYLYKDALLFALDHSVTFAKQLKRRVEKCIMQLTPDAIAALQSARISLIEVLDGISVQLTMDEKQGKALEATEGPQNRPNECAICLSDLQGNFMVLPCHATHAFHNDCIKQWVNRQGPNLSRYWRKICYLYNKLPCPICRVNFGPNDFGIISDYGWCPSQEMPCN